MYHDCMDKFNSPYGDSGSFNWGDLQNRINDMKSKEALSAANNEIIDNFDKQALNKAKLEELSAARLAKHINSVPLNISSQAGKLLIGEINQTTNPITKSEISFSEFDSRTLVDKFENTIVSREYKRNEADARVKGYTDLIRIPGSSISVKSSFDNNLKQKLIVVTDKSEQSGKELFRAEIPFDSSARESQSKAEKYIDIPSFDEALGFADFRQKMLLTKKDNPAYNYELDTGKYNLSIESGNILIKNKSNDELIFAQNLTGKNLIFYPQDLSNKETIDGKTELKREESSNFRTLLSKRNGEIVGLLRELDEKNAETIKLADGRAFTKDQLNTMLDENMEMLSQFTRKDMYMAMSKSKNDLSKLELLNKKQVPAIAISTEGIISIFRPDESSLKQIGSL